MAEGTKRSGLAAFLAALLVPPAVAGGLGQQFVIHHPAWAVVIGVAYEAVAAIGGYFALITGDLLGRWRPLIVDRLDLFLRRENPRFERRYREAVLAGLQSIDQKGLISVGAFTPALDAVFVDVTLIPRPPQGIRPDVLPGLAGDHAGRRALSQFLGRTDPVVLAVVGAPGSGKSTLLRHAAQQACLRPPSRRDRRDHVRRIPVLLYLRDHAAAITADQGVSPAKLLRGTQETVFSGEPSGWLEQRLKDGLCLVLLDGLDEVARQEDRARVAVWAERQVQAYPDNHFVISSRPLGFQSARVEGAEIVQVCGFTSDQVTRFVEGWYREVERHRDTSVAGVAGGIHASQDADARAHRSAEALLRLLEQAPAIYDLAVSPLLLTMIANVHEYRGTLPRGRGDLYSEICEVVLWRRQEAKGLQQPLSGVKKKTILADLAYTMMQRRVSDLHRTDALAAIRPGLRRVSASITPDDFLAQSASDGLLIEREPDQYAFAHKTFQEYLAAVHIREKGLVTVLTDAVSDDWWTEVTLFYAAQSDADPIIRACLDADTIPALALAFECADQDSDLDPDLRARLATVLASAAGADAPSDRHRLAGVLLSRHLRQRSRTTAGTQVCVRPIPNEIYRLFLADTRVPPPDANPEIMQASAGIAVGIRGSDATAFLDWANSMTGSQPTYRLPIAAELRELATQQRIPALPSGDQPDVWTHTEKGRPRNPQVHRLPPHAPRPYGADHVTLTDAIARDLAGSVPLLCMLLLQHAKILTYLHPYDHVDQRLQTDRALNRARSLVFALDRTLDRDVALALVLERAPVRDLDRTLVRDLDRDLARYLERTHAGYADHELDRALERALDLDLTLDGARARAVDRALGHALDRARAHAVDPTRELTFDLERARYLARALVLSHDILVTAGDFNAAASRTEQQDSLEPLDRHAIGNATRLVMGRAFSDAISRSLTSTSGPFSFIAHFNMEFADAVGSEKVEPLASPELLPEILRSAVDTLRNALPHGGEVPGSPSWPAVAAERLAQNANPVFSRGERPTEEKSAAIRLAALCLASEADGIGREDIGAKFRQVAAGITWLMQRASGELPATEALMLAVE